MGALTGACNVTRVECARATGRMAGARASSHECRRAGLEPGERPEGEDSQRGKSLGG